MSKQYGPSRSPRLNVPVVDPRAGGALELAAATKFIEFTDRLVPVPDPPADLASRFTVLDASTCSGGTGDPRKARPTPTTVDGQMPASRSWLTSLTSAGTAECSLPHCDGPGPVLRTPCGHALHELCAYEWYSWAHTRPVCRDEAPALEANWNVIRPARRRAAPRRVVVRLVRVEPASPSGERSSPRAGSAAS